MDATAGSSMPGMKILVRVGGDHVSRSPESSMVVRPSREFQEITSISCQTSTVLDSASNRPLQQDGPSCIRGSKRRKIGMDDKDNGEDYEPRRTARKSTGGLSQKRETAIRLDSSAASPMRSSKRLRTRHQVVNSRIQSSECGPTAGSCAGLSEDESDDAGTRLVIVDPETEVWAVEARKLEKRRQARLVSFYKKISEVRLTKKDDAPTESPAKKRKPHSKTVKKYYEIPMTPDAKPVFPIQLRGLSVISLGTVVFDRKKFHAKRYIWPVGFKSTRRWTSIKDPDSTASYMNEILDGGDEPRFKVTCMEGTDNEEETVFEANTSSGAWAEIGRRVCEHRESVSGKRILTQLSGPEMFGFGLPTISKLIQELPGADLCHKYLFQKFVPSSSSLSQIMKRSSGTVGAGKGQKQHQQPTPPSPPQHNSTSDTAVPSIDRLDKKTDRASLDSKQAGNPESEYPVRRRTRDLDALLHDNEGNEGIYPFAQ